jgi:alpha-tubulin suppressor-like RCC1 family protein
VIVVAFLLGEKTFARALEQAKEHTTRRRKNMNDIIVRGNWISEKYNTPTRIALPIPSYTRIKKIVYAYDCPYILLYSGKVWSVSNGDASVYEPTSQLNVKDIIRSEGAVAFVTVDGQCYYNGANSYEKFGPYSDPNSKLNCVINAEWSPEDKSEKITQVGCCFSSTVIVTNNKKLYILGQFFWFMPRSGNHNFSRPVYLPIANHDYEIVTMCGAYFHAVALLSNGEVWVGGENSSNYKLGVANSGSQTWYNLNECNQLKEKFTIAECGINFSVFVTESKNVYVSGDAFSQDNVQVTTTLSKIRFSPRTAVVSVCMTYDTVIVTTRDGIYSNKDLTNQTDENHSTINEINYDIMTHEYNKVAYLSGTEVFYKGFIPDYMIIAKQFRKGIFGFEDVLINFKE